MGEDRKEEAENSATDTADSPAAGTDPGGETAADAPATTAAVPDGQQEERPREIGGRDGPDPTRYGDWEKGGRCIDF